MGLIADMKDEKHYRYEKMKSVKIYDLKETGPEKKLSKKIEKSPDNFFAV